MTISVRLDAQAQAALDRLARERGLSPSRIVRESLVRFAATAGRSGGADASPYDRVAHLVGCVSGPKDLARRASERVREIIAAKQRARRPR